MAGFLSHIAARLGGSERLLQPRVASLFEPAPTVESDPTLAFSTLADAHPLTGGLGSVEEHDARGVANPPPLPVPAQRSGSGRLLRPRVASLFEPAPTASLPVPPSAHRRAAIGIFTRDGPTLDRRRDPRPGVMRDDLVRGASTHDPWSAQPFAEAEPSVRHREAARDVVASSNPSTAIRPAGLAPRKPSVSLRQAQPSDSVEQIGSPRADVRSDNSRISAGRSDAAISVAITAEDRDSISASLIRALPAAGGILQAPAIARIVAAPPPWAPRTSTGEPTIQVTIGRVEVRAVAASPSESARAERPSPVMSLDEYLRTRRK